MSCVDIWSLQQWLGRPLLYRHSRVGVGACNDSPLYRRDSDSTVAPNSLIVLIAHDRIVGKLLHLMT